MQNTMKYLEHAIELAEKGIKIGCGPFGAVIVKDNEIIASAVNSVTLNHDPTAHAEILAIRQAAAKLATHNLEGCTIFATCEPCPMCLGAIYWSGINKVIYAANRNDAASAGFNDKLIYEEIALDPIERNVEFLCVNHKGALALFKKWSLLEDRISY